MACFFSPSLFLLYFSFFFICHRFFIATVPSGSDMTGAQAPRSRENSIVRRVVSFRVAHARNEKDGSIFSITSASERRQSHTHSYKENDYFHFVARLLPTWNEKSKWTSFSALLSIRVASQYLHHIVVYRQVNQVGHYSTGASHFLFVQINKVFVSSTLAVI